MPTRAALPELPFLKRKLWTFYAYYANDAMVGPIDMAFPGVNCEGNERLFFLAQWIENPLAPSYEPCLLIHEFSDDGVTWANGHATYMSQIYLPPYGIPAADNQFYSGSIPVQSSLVRMRLSWPWNGTGSFYINSYLSP